MENVNFIISGNVNFIIKVVTGVGRRGEFLVCKKQMSSHGYQKISVAVSEAQ